MKRILIGSFACVLTAAGVLVAQSNIDDTVPNKHAWGENIGWTNWRDANAALQGVQVGPFVMSGFIWGENVGWITVGDGTPLVPPHYANVDGSDFGVNIDGAGFLHGFAWGENIGWINFDGGAMATPPQPARVLCADPPGLPRARLTGFAWGENVGWINLAELTETHYVALDDASTPIACDVNHDGFVNGLDIQPFINLLLLRGGSWSDLCAGDQPPQDNVIDLADVGPFVACLLN
ncbi:hypothetical protein RAS2_12370 [Phycisphaerae bacterium RAS2]|nr:hypothetical protein RAS2_12370 [Phycisphaerae bacterium RAS2]